MFSLDYMAAWVSGKISSGMDTYAFSFHIFLMGIQFLWSWGNRKHSLPSLLLHVKTCSGCKFFPVSEALFWNGRHTCPGQSDLPSKCFYYFYQGFIEAWLILPFPPSNNFATQTLTGSEFCLLLHLSGYNFNRQPNMTKSSVCFTSWFQPSTSGFTEMSSVTGEWRGETGSELQLKVSASGSLAWAEDGLSRPVTLTKFPVVSKVIHLVTREAR